MIFYENDDTQAFTFNDPHNYTEGEEIKYNDIDTNMYSAIFHFDADGKKTPLFYNDETKKYITLHYAQMNQVVEDGYVKQEFTNYAEAIQCTDGLFERHSHEARADLYNKWKGFSIICPVNDSNIQFNGTENSVTSQSMAFLVKTCNPDTTTVPGGCYSEDKIEKFVNRVAVDSWANHDEVDFSLHWEEPRIRKEVWIRSDVMHYGNIDTNWITLQRNEVETEDSWLLIG